MVNNINGCWKLSVKDTSELMKKCQKRHFTPLMLFLQCVSICIYQHMTQFMKGNQKKAVACVVIKWAISCVQTLHQLYKAFAGVK